MSGKMKKTTKKPLEPNTFSETFFLTFIGEFVEVAGSFFHGEVEVPIRIQGYILDSDDQFYFLGDTPEEISSAIRKTSVVYIEIVEDNPMKDALRDWEPDSEVKN